MRAITFPHPSLNHFLLGTSDQRSGVFKSIGRGCFNDLGMAYAFICLAAYFILSLLFIAYPISQANADNSILTGAVTKVRDGDTIEVGKIPIRLNGVSAPEMKEPLGPQSKAFMTDLVMATKGTKITITTINTKLICLI